MELASPGKVTAAAHSSAQQLFIFPFAVSASHSSLRFSALRAEPRLAGSFFGSASHVLGLETSEYQEVHHSQGSDESSSFATLWFSSAAAVPQAAMAKITLTTVE